MRYLKTIIIPVIVGAPGMIKKGKDQYMNKIPSSPSQYEKQKKLHFTELLIFFGENYQSDKKISPKISS